MSSKFVVTDNSEELSELFNDAARLIGGGGLVAEATRDAMSVFQAAVQRGSVGVLSKDPTGALANSWEPGVAVNGSKVEGWVRSGVPYAGIHETGGTIKPRNSQYLAIPFPGGGVPRGMSAKRDPTKMAAWKSSQGNLILWDISDPKNPKPRYLLKDSVEIPETNYISSAIQESQKDAVAAFTHTMNRGLDATKGAK